METLTSHNITVMFLSLGILLCVARGLGELAQRFHQPAVLGELIAGVLLGPTVLGTLAPGVSQFLFPLEGVNAIGLETFATLAIGLFLLVAGMEVDLSTVWKQGRIGLKVGIASIVIPFSIALARGVGRTRGAWQACGRRSADLRAVFCDRHVDFRPARHCQNAHGHGPLPQRSGHGGRQRGHLQRPCRLDRFRRYSGPQGGPLRERQQHLSDHCADAGLCRRNAYTRPVADSQGAADCAGAYPLSGGRTGFCPRPGALRRGSHRVDRHSCDLRGLYRGGRRRRLIPPPRAQPGDHR